MNIPPPGVIRNPGPNLYETLYQPFDGPLDFLTPDVELPKHVQEVVGQNPHLQPGLVGLGSTLLAPPKPASRLSAVLKVGQDRCANDHSISSASKYDNNFSSSDNPIYT